jgi:hypothetical protein
LVLLPGLDGTEIFFGLLLSQRPSWIDSVVITYPPSGPNAYDDLVPIVLEDATGTLGCCRAAQGVIATFSTPSRWLANSS